MSLVWFLAQTSVIFSHDKPEIENSTRQNKLPKNLKWLEFIFISILESAENVLKQFNILPKQMFVLIAGDQA